MTYENITLVIDKHVALLTFNRPQSLNALSIPMLVDMDDALDTILDPAHQVRCLLLTGSGRGFSSGADLAAGGAPGATPSGKPRKIDAGRVLETHFNPLLERLLQLPIPFITAVNGVAAGAGCSFAVAGDIVLAARSAYFLQAFVNIGLVPDVGSSWLLPRLIGKARAQAMMMLGERVTAETAERWGLVYQMVEDEQLLPRAMDLAQRLAQGPTTALKLIRRLVHEGLENDLTSQLRQERVAQQQAGLTADFLEGVSAFLAKRPAHFSGR